MMRYLVVIEKAGKNYSAYVPDLPGCVSTGKTPAATRAAIRAAIDFHIEGMRADGLPIPKPSARSAEVAVSAPAPTRKGGRKAA
ncbi:MAG TPA: type II toxin-antitoxin system HicB family antitoxin [Phycisphaerales bacterium]|nr:type II toxin-antitoxin system HicB family antitoxin [Phycisphaerales bacterium]